MDKTKRKRDVVTTTVTYVHWVDAVADCEWQTDVKAEIHDCYTVGFIVNETAEAICIASTVSDKDSNARMHIPKAWIKERKVVKFETKQRKSEGQNIPAVGKRSNTSKVLS
jgi:hypothetical protein